MRLPLKFLPRMSQLIADVVGGAIMLGFGLAFFSDYAAPADIDRYNGFLGWLRVNWADLPFMLASILLLLFGLAWLTVAVINLASNSPFNHLIVDRTGITYRNFWRENRYPWANLGLIQPLRFSAWQGRSSQRRNWIVADASGEDKVYGSAPFWSNPTDTLRIPANVYLGGGLMIGTLELATSDAARWLEELRQRARDGGLDTDIPPPPGAFRAPIEIDAAAPAIKTGGAVDRG
jgi:hypothetical protein